MTNLEMYKKIFMENFKVKEDDLPKLQYQKNDLWDSIGHMDLIVDLEDAFEIQMMTPDVLDLTSYVKGKEVLEEYGIIIEKEETDDI